MKERLDHIAFGIVKGDSLSGASIDRREIDCTAPIAVGRGPLDDGEWTYIRTDGQPLTPDIWYARTHGFRAGHAVVEVRSDESSKVRLWGILNERGEYTLQPGPERIFRRSEMVLADGRPYFLVGTGEYQSAIDASGELVVTPASIAKDHRKQAVQCRGGGRIVEGADGFGIEGPDGEMMVPAIHRAISCYRNGVAWAPIQDLKKWCPIGPEGVFRDNPACIVSYYPYSMTHHFPEVLADDPFESNILWVRAWLHWGLDKRSTPPVWVGDGVRSQVSYSVAPFRGP